jgi:Transmembrane secretion effector
MGLTAGSYLLILPDPNHFHVEIMMPSWSQYLLHCERITKAEKEVIDRALGLHLGENPPETRMYVRVNKTFREGTGTR